MAAPGSAGAVRSVPGLADLFVPGTGRRAGDLAARLLARLGSLGKPSDPSATAVPRTSGPRPLDGADPALHLYFRTLFAGLREEHLHVVYCDAGKRYLADETLSRGGISQVLLRGRDLFGRALAIGASGFLLAHNHLSGDCRPSLEDVETTKRLEGVAAALELELVDHLIFTSRSACSMRGGGYI